MEDLVNEIMEEHEEYEKQSMEVRGEPVNNNSKMETDPPIEIKREIPDSPPPLILAPHVILTPDAIKKEPAFPAPQSVLAPEQKSENSSSRTVIFPKDARSSPKVELPVSPPSLFEGPKVRGLVRYA